LVTSIDVDEALVVSARKRLHGLSYVPALAAADGACGYAANAPYNRILSTVTLPHVPACGSGKPAPKERSWSTCIATSAVGALALLAVHDSRAEGHFLPDCGGFMPVRSARGPSAFELLQAADTNAGVKRETALDGQVLDDPTFGFFAALSLPAHRIEVIPEAGPAQLWLLSRDGSWTRQTLDAGSTVIQYGRRRLWDELESAHSEWETLGRPERQQFGLTVHQDGPHALWCGEPGYGVAELVG
jgi:Protein-L-isoaspartate(D-aspartate) O-methyltransferase (PCMT)